MTAVELSSERVKLKPEVKTVDTNISFKSIGTVVILNRFTEFVAEIYYLGVRYVCKEINVISVISYVIIYGISANYRPFVRARSAEYDGIHASDLNIIRVLYPVYGNAACLSSQCVRFDNLSSYFKGLVVFFLYDPPGKSLVVFNNDFGQRRIKILRNILVAMVAVHLFDKRAVGV